MDCVYASQRSGCWRRRARSVSSWRPISGTSQGRPASASNGELRGLREAGLVETRPYVIGRDRATLVTLTERGRELLERHRRTDREVRPQTYYAGFVKPRELSHDAQLYRAYERIRRTPQREGRGCHAGSSSTTN